MEQWRQLTTQRLATELVRQPDAAARRARLRHWQRAYHPDKNPGRADEVLPIFRWVQEAWDRDFRSSDIPGAAQTSKRSSAQADRGSAKKQSRRSDVAAPE